MNQKRVVRILSILIMVVGFMNVCYAKAIPSDISVADITAEGCNIDIEQASDQKDMLDYDKKLFEVTSNVVDQKLTIKAKMKDKVKNDQLILERVKIYIPSSTKSMSVLADKAGVSIGKMDIDLVVNSQKGACSIDVPAHYGHKLMYTCEKSSGSIMINTENEYTLNFQEVDSAVALGSYFKGYKKGIPYQYVVGKGTAVIDINVKNSSFSMDIDNEKESFSA